MPDPITQIIIAIIGTLGIVGAAAIPFWFNRKRSDSANTAGDAQPKPIASTPAYAAAKVLPRPSIHRNTAVERSDAEVRKIADSIIATPPYSQAHVMEQFKGRAVSWVGTLNSVEEAKDGIGAIIHVGDRTCVMCRGASEAAAILRTAHRGEHVLVSGKILKVLNEYVLYLSECSFAEYEESEQAVGERRR